MHELRNIAQRLRHDLLKHLDMPKPGQILSETEAKWLNQRLFTPKTGTLVLAAKHIASIRTSPNYTASLGPSLSKMRLATEKLKRLRNDFEASCERHQPIDPAFLSALLELEDGVLAFEAVCALETGQTLDEASDSEQAVLDFIGWGEAKSTSSTPNKQTVQSASRAVADDLKSDKIRILVVDDRLLSVDRLELRDSFMERFEWVRLCESATPCAQCRQNEGCDKRRARSYQEAADTIEREQALGRRIDVVLMDLRFDDLQADELLWIPEHPELNRLDSVKSLQGLVIARQLRKLSAFGTIPIVLMTARHQLPMGADKLLEGLEGLQFVDDETSLDVLATRLEGVVKLARELPKEQCFFWGMSPQMQHIRRQVELMSQGPRTVLLTGPSGSGKSYLVEQVIFPASGRSELITLDLSAVPDALVESELFGHVKGAFSGAVSDRRGLVEEADTGILFLDEIGNLSLENQRKLLLFLQDKMLRRVGAAHNTRRRVDVKVIAATHLDLNQEVKAGRFRFDLYMRLGPAMQIGLPRLAERRDDLPDLIVTLIKRILSSDDMSPYVAELAERCGVSTKVNVDFSKTSSPPGKGLCVRFPQATRKLFLQYAWPGNTREMESVLDTLVLKAFYDLKLAASATQIIEIDHYYALSLLGGMQKSAATSTGPSTGLETPKRASGFVPLQSINSFASLRQSLESQYLRDLYHYCKGDLGQMATHIFGDDNSALHHKIMVRMNQLGLSLRALKAQD